MKGLDWQSMFDELELLDDQIRQCQSSRNDIVQRLRCVDKRLDELCRLSANIGEALKHYVKLHPDDATLQEMFKVRFPAEF